MIVKQFQKGKEVNFRVDHWSMEERKFAQIQKLGEKDQLCRKTKTSRNLTGQNIFNLAPNLP